MPGRTLPTSDLCEGDDFALQAGHIYPITLFLRIQCQMKRLNLTPADCLQLLAEALDDLDRQITEFEAGDEGAELPF